jgi:hypothetical protein
MTLNKNIKLIENSAHDNILKTISKDFDDFNVNNLIYKTILVIKKIYKKLILDLDSYKN